jgi:hypothetical protein
MASCRARPGPLGAVMVAILVSCLFGQDHPPAKLDAAVLVWTVCGTVGRVWSRARGPAQRVWHPVRREVEPWWGSAQIL